MKEKIKRRSKGFTLVELVIVIAIVIILSVISVPIYRGYVDKSKMAEGYALLGTTLSAQKAYYSEHGYFYQHLNITSYMPEINIDVRGNKYFTCFDTGTIASWNPKVRFASETPKPMDLRGNGKTWLQLWYNITTGSTFVEYPF